MTPNAFYDECLDGFLSVAQRFGYANFGAKFNDVLMKRSEQSVRELLKFRPLIKLFGNDPMTYYYYINGLAFAMGVVLAMLQANAPEKFQDRNLIPMIVNDPETSAHDLAFHTLQQFGMNPDIYNQLVQEIFKKFQELHEPYWKAKEPRDYTLAAFYASFITGCSVVVERIEMKRLEKPAPKKEETKKPVPKKTSTRKASTKKSSGKKNS